MTDPAPAPWERQPDERPSAFEAFRTYRDMPERSIRKVASVLKRNPRSVANLNTRHAWAERIAAWEAEQDRIHREFLADQRRKATKRQLKELEAFRSPMLDIARALMKRIRTKPEELDGMPMADLVRNAVKAAQVYAAIVGAEREVMGFASELQKAHTAAAQALAVQRGHDVTESTTGPFVYTVTSVEHAISPGIEPPPDEEPH